MIEDNNLDINNNSQSILLSESYYVAKKSNKLIRDIEMCRHSDEEDANEAGKCLRLSLE